mgnify:CR=1 FL=1
MENKSSFRLVFGNSPIVKVIDFFLENREFDYSLTDIAKNSDIGWSTLHLFWKDLITMEVVIKTRRIGRAELYKLNLNSALVKRLLELDKIISKKFIEKDLIKQKSRIIA